MRQLKSTRDRKHTAENRRRRRRLARIVRREEWRYRSMKYNALLCGWMFVIMSLALFIWAVEEYGVLLGTLIGVPLAGIFLGAGVVLLRWSKRMRRPGWVDILRFRLTPNDDQPRGPASPNQENG